MAYERLSDKKVIATNLNGFIQSNLVLLKNQRTQRNLDDESNFQSQVLADNLSLEDQVSYRKEQIKRSGGDKDEVRRLKTEIASLKDQIEARDYRNAYLDKINDLNTGASSIDSTISWLQTRLAATTDSAIKKNIQDNLSSLMQKRFQLQQDTLDKQVDFATNDKTETVLNKAINNVTKARKDALLAGNDNYVAVLDISLQNLNKSLNESKITKALTDMSVGSLTGQSAVALLNKFNDEISSADSATPITVGGVRYDNAQEFWNAKRSDFLNDRSDNGFFSRYKSEINAQVDYKVSKGIMTNDTIADVGRAYDALNSRPELKDYTTQLQQEKQSTLQRTADYRSNQIINQFATDLDATKAVRALGEIQATYGVDQTANYQKIIIKASQEKTDQLNSLLQATSQIMSDNPGLSQEQAFQKAVQSGAGVAYSPTALATKSPEQLIKEGQANPTGSPITVDTKDQGFGTFNTPKLNEGDVVKTKDSGTVYVFKNGQLQALADQFNPEEFKQATGKTFQQVQTLETFGNTPVGPNLTKADLIPAVAQPTPAQPATQPNPDQSIVPGTTPTPAAPAPQAQDYIVKAGDTLSKISQQFYKDPKKYQNIFDANKDVLSNPNQIKVGQKLKIPTL